MTRCALTLIFVLSAIAGQSQPLENDDFCAILQAHMEAGTQGCLANAAPYPADGSYVYLTQKGADLRVLLLRADLGAGGDCRPSKDSFFRDNLCITLDYETAPNHAEICTFAGHPSDCSDGLRRSKYAQAKPGVTPTTVGGHHPAPSERFFVAARGLKAGDVAVQEIGGAIAYKAAIGANGRPVRLFRDGDVTPALRLRAPADNRAALYAALTAIEAAGVTLSDVVAVGLAGRFIARDGGSLIFHGISTDCGGACSAREVLDAAAFDARIADWSAEVAIETPSADLRDLLMDRLLLGPQPHAPVDDALDAARVRQAPALLLLNWD